MTSDKKTPSDEAHAQPAAALTSDKKTPSDEARAQPAAALGACAQTAPSAVGPFVEAYKAYLRRLKDGWEAAQEGLKGTNCKHTNTLEALRGEVEKSYTSAWRRYGEEVQRISTASLGSLEERQRVAAEAQQRYMSALSTAQVDAAKKWEALKDELQQAVSTSQKNYAEHCKSAYKSYLADVKQAWQSIDVGALDPAALATINSLAAQAVQYAWYTGVR